jgi:hypothetical protein
MYWYQLAENPQALTGLYDKVPLLESVQLFEVCMNREGPALCISVELPNFPDHPPSKWHKSYNTAQVKLYFFGVELLVMDGWDTTMRISFSMERSENNRILVSIEAANFRMSFNCLGFRIDRITGYMVAL